MHMIQIISMILILSVSSVLAADKKGYVSPDKFVVKKY